MRTPFSHEGRATSHGGLFPQENEKGARMGQPAIALSFPEEQLATAVATPEYHYKGRDAMTQSLEGTVSAKP